MKKLEKIKIFFASLRLKNILAKIGRLGVGITIFQLINKFTLLFVNPTILVIFEFRTALILMIFFSIVLRYVMIKIYDSRKIDWFFIESLKRGDDVSLSKKTSIMRKILRYGGKYLLTTVLFIYDPFLIVIYFRKDHFKWNGIPTFKTWSLFILSCITCALVSAGWIKPIINVIF